MDKVVIQDLNIETIIGLYPWEKQVKQPMVVNVELGWDIRKAAATGDLQHTLNYAEVVASIHRYAAEHNHLLLEPFCEDLARILIQQFSIPWLRLQVGKTTTITEARQVGIQIERSSHDYPVAD